MSDESKRAPSRRKVLGGLAALAALGLARPGFAAEGAALPALGPGQPVDSARFLALSQWLTGREDLDELTAEALRAGFASAGQDERIAALYRAAPMLRIDPALGGEMAVTALREAGVLDTALAVLRGWYLGRISKPDGKEVLVAYESTLMAEVVGDMLALPSYCSGVPHFWAVPPAVKDL